MTSPVGTDQRSTDVVRLIEYDGPAVTGQMDARDLAPAMLSTARLFEHTAQQLYGTTSTLKIDVQADFRSGSFLYVLITEAVVGIGAQLWANMSVSDIIETSRSFFNLAKLFRGRTPRGIERAGANAQITFHDGDNLTVNVRTP